MFLNVSNVVCLSRRRDFEMDDAGIANNDKIQKV